MKFVSRSLLVGHLKEINSLLMLQALGMAPA